MNTVIKGSLELRNELLKINSIQTDEFKFGVMNQIFGIKFIEDNSLYPIDITVSACDIETRKEIKIKTNQKIIGAIYNANSHVLLIK